MGDERFWLKEPIPDTNLPPRSWGLALLSAGGRPYSTEQGAQKYS
jgi:hypothetical protein